MAVDEAGNESDFSIETAGMAHVAIDAARLAGPASLTHTISTTVRTAEISGEENAANGWLRPHDTRCTRGLTGGVGIVRCQWPGHGRTECKVGANTVSICGIACQSNACLKANPARYTPIWPLAGGPNSASSN